MPEHDPQPEDDPAAGDEPEKETFLDKLRGGGVGTEDPTIVGDAGPTDIPPGIDDDTGDPLLVTTDEPVDHLEV
ncbi:MAG: hypothetical protein ABIS47_10295 [Acidimicrobiales bacterium]